MYGRSWYPATLYVELSKTADILERGSKLTENVFPVEAKICLLHIYPENFPVTVKKRKLINFCLLQAKRVIALKWKEIQRPTVGQWITEMSSNLALEKLTYMARGKVEDFNKTWSSFLTFMNNLNVQPRTGQDLLPPPL